MTNTENDQHNLVGYSKQQNVNAWMGPNTPSYLCWGFQFGILGQFVNDHFGDSRPLTLGLGKTIRTPSIGKDSQVPRTDHLIPSKSMVGKWWFFRTKVLEFMAGGSVERSEALVPCQPWSNTNETSLGRYEERHLPNMAGKWKRVGMTKICWWPP